MAKSTMSEVYYYSFIYEFANKVSTTTSRLAMHRNRLRSALEVKHVAVFFCANAIFQIKEMTTEPESDESKILEKREKEQYETAKEVRREILQEVNSKLLTSKILAKLERFFIKQISS